MRTAASFSKHFDCGWNRGAGGWLLLLLLLISGGVDENQSWTAICNHESDQDPDIEIFALSLLFVAVGAVAVPAPLLPSTLASDCCNGDHRKPYS
jgi:hypothetical protein